MGLSKGGYVQEVLTKLDSADPHIFLYMFHEVGMRILDTSIFFEWGEQALKEKSV